MPQLNNQFPYFGAVSALAFDKSTATYYAGCEEIWLGDAEWSPRFYEISLSFDGKTDNGTAKVLRRVDVGHDEGIKIEGADVSPRGELWLCSEMNSGNQARLMPPSSFLQRSFGFKDVGIIQDGQPQDWPSRVVRVNKTSGAVLSSAQLPSYVPWDGEWSWNAQQCHGTRHLAGLQAFAFTSDGRLAITAGQSALYQDGGGVRRRATRARLCECSTTMSTRPTLAPVPAPRCATHTRCAIGPRASSAHRPSRSPTSTQHSWGWCR